MTSVERKLSLDPGALRTIGQTQLERLTRGIAVLGVPPDLLTVAARLQPCSSVQLIESFYLPGLLTYAFIHHALGRGALRRDASGNLSVADRRAAGPTNSEEAPRTSPAEASSLGSSDLPSFAAGYGDLVPGRTALCIGRLTELSRALLERRLRRVVLIGEQSEEAELAGVQTLGGDVRFLSGIYLEPFDVVIADVPSDHDESALACAVANLRPHAPYYIRIPAASCERSRLAALLCRLEEELVVTDLRGSRAPLVIRAVKYPELHSDPDLFRHFL